MTENQVDNNLVKTGAPVLVTFWVKKGDAIRFVANPDVGKGFVKRCHAVGFKYTRWYPSFRGVRMSTKAQKGKAWAMLRAAERKALAEQIAAQVNAPTQLELFP